MSRNSQSRATADERLDRIFMALSDPTRRALLKRLMQGPAIVSKLAAPFDMSRIAVSKHLRILERAHLVQRSINGRVHCCSITAEPLADAQQWLRQYQTFWSDTLQSLSRYAGRKKTGKRN